MVRLDELVVWLSEVDKYDNIYVGNKASQLGEIIHAGFPIPSAFVVTISSFQEFLTYNKLSLKIKQLLSHINFDDPNSVADISRHIRRIILESEIPPAVVKNIFSYYTQLCNDFTDTFIAVRQSQVLDTDYSGNLNPKQDSYLNIKGEAALLEKVKHIWSLSYSPAALIARHTKKIKNDIYTAIIVQKMINPTTSGVIYTSDPASSDPTKMRIEACVGITEHNPSARDFSDHYIIFKDSLSFKEKGISHQTTMLIKSGDGNKKASVPFYKRRRQKISDETIKKLVEVGKKVEHYYYFPQIIEWAVENGFLYILNIQPVTHTAVSENKKVSENKQLLVKGDSAVPGIGIGPVRLIKSNKDISQVRTGDVLVVAYLSRDYIPSLKKAAAVIVERDEHTSYAQVIIKSMTVPTLIGASNSMKALSNGLVVTVDGMNGTVYKGSILTTPSPIQKSLLPATKTKLLLTMRSIEEDTKVEADTDGVGLLEGSELVKKLGLHPKKVIHEGKEKIYSSKLAEAIESVCKAYYPKPVFYKLSDLTTSDYLLLRGGKEYEIPEHNPVLGLRGALRHIHDKHALGLELEALRLCREKKKYTNLHLTFSYVRTISELIELKKILQLYNLRQSPTFKLCMVANVPTNVIMLDEYINEKIDGVYIEPHDLAMLLQAIDKDNEEIAHSFNMRDEVLLACIEKIIKTCKKNKIDSLLAWSMPAVYHDLIAQAIAWGVSAISVPASTITATRLFIHATENTSK